MLCNGIIIQLIQFLSHKIGRKLSVFKSGSTKENEKNNNAYNVRN